MGRQILGNLLQSCSTAASGVVKPDGNPVKLEPYTPMRTGTPKRRKNVNAGGRSSLTGRSSLSGRPSLTGRASLTGRTSFAGRVSLAGRASLTGRASLSRPTMTAVPQSPTKGSPRKRKVAGPKKSLSYSPKKPPPKPPKKSVQWKDDINDGSLAEFEKTPQRIPPSVDGSPDLPPPPIARLGSAIPLPSNNGSRESSPIPVAPEMPTLHVQKNRFKAGFLSKKGNGSPHLASMTKLPPSDNEQSPLRDIANSSLLNRRLSGNSSSGAEDDWTASKQEAMEIKTAMRRLSGAGSGAGNSISRVHRRRSPTGASAGSPSNENAMFTASQARRMVKSDKEHEFKSSVLSPRTLPITKVVGGRRTTIGEARSREVSLSSRDGGARYTGSNIPSGSHSRQSSGAYR